MMRLLFLLLAFSALFLHAAEEPTTSSIEGRGWDSVELRLSYYENDDSPTSGNPFLDEELQVLEPVVIFTYNVSDTQQAWGKLSYDWVSSASIKRLSKYPSQSGATGDYYLGAAAGYNWFDDPQNQWSIHTHFSKEYDYTSVGAGAGWAREFDEIGGKLDLKFNGFYDTIEIIRYNGLQNEGSDTRISLTGSAGWYQTYTPRLHGEFGGLITAQSGFLETAYNSVVIEDGVPVPSFIPSDLPGREVSEQLPDERIRAALYGRWRYATTDSIALELGGRAYVDDWGIASLALEPRAYIELIEDRLLLRARYRFYTQTESDHFSHEFLTEQDFRTQDADLGNYHAHTLGLNLSYTPNATVSYDLGFDYTFRSDGLDYSITSAGVKTEF